MPNNIPKLAIASGKGGVGKSLLASSLAILFENEKNIQAIDCDVDTPNLAIWLDEAGDWKTEKEISTLENPEINDNKCTNCGTCIQKCPTGALKMTDEGVKLNEFLCEGCKTCAISCPEDAITMKPVKNGVIRSKKTAYGFELFSGQLKPGNSNSGKVVSEVKKEAIKNSKNKDLMIFDTPPGTGCPVIAALRDVDFVILITEPTPTGLADLNRSLETVNHFQIPYRVVINKYDLNQEITAKIETKFEDKIIGKISYDKKILEAIAQMKPILETELKAKNEIENIFSKLNLLLKRQIDIF